MIDEHTTLRVQEFARLAGVTVRALHLYDEAGLLSPAKRTARGHRRYRCADLLRLQQILTLKHLGFSLDQIRALLTAPAYDLRESLRNQKAAIESRIMQLQGVAYALARTLEALETAQQVDWTQVIAVIQGLRDASRSEWLSRFFPPEQWEWLRERAAHTPQELIDQGTAAWVELYDAFRQHIHLPADHPAVQRLAAQMNRLIELFSAGRPEVKQGLAALYRDPAQVPPALRVDPDPQLQAFMGQALAIYRETEEAQREL